MERMGQGTQSDAVVEEMEAAVRYLTEGIDDMAGLDPKAAAIQLDAIRLAIETLEVVAPTMGRLLRAYLAQRLSGLARPTAQGSGGRARGGA